MDLRCILELESKRLAVVGGKEEGGSRMTSSFLACGDEGTIFETGRNKHKELGIILDGW